MIAPGPEMRCPHCGSREFWPSRKKPWEFLLGLILPLRTYRCRNCLKRYLIAPRWLALLPRVLGAAVAGVLLLASGVLVGRFLWPGPDSVGAERRNQAALSAAPTDSPRPQAIAAPPAPAAQLPAPATLAPASQAPAAREATIQADSGPAGGMGSVHFNVQLDIVPAGAAGRGS